MISPFWKSFTLTYSLNFVRKIRMVFEEVRNSIYPLNLLAFVRLQWFSAFRLVKLIDYVARYTLCNVNYCIGRISNRVVRW